jgi:hypothetical protein
MRIKSCSKYVKGRDQLGNRPRGRREDIQNKKEIDLIVIGGENESEFNWKKNGPMVGFFEHGNKPSCSTKQFLDRLNDYSFLSPRCTMGLELCYLEH